MCVILNQCLAERQACNIYSEWGGRRGERAKEGRSVNLAPGTWHWWTGPWGRTEERERKNVTCSDEERGIEERERSRKGVREGASVSLERKERYAWLCDSSYIEHSVCVDTVSCISLRNKLFLVAQYRASSFHLYSSLPLSKCTLSSSHHPNCFPSLSLIWILSLTQHICVTSTCFHSVPLPLDSLDVSSSSFCVSWIQLCFTYMNERKPLFQKQQLGVQ